MGGSFLSFCICPAVVDLFRDTVNSPVHDILGVGTGIAVDNGPDLFAACTVLDTDRRLEYLLL